MKRLFILCFLIHLFSINGCKKDSRIHYTIPPQSLSYFVYQQGSFWIYHESYSNASDSTYIKLNPQYWTEGADKSEERPWRDYIRVTFSGGIIENFLLDPSSVSLYEAYDQGGELLFLYPKVDYFITTANRNKSKVLLQCKGLTFAAFSDRALYGILFELIKVHP